MNGFSIGTTFRDNCNTLVIVRWRTNAVTQCCDVRFAATYTSDATSIGDAS